MSGRNWTKNRQMQTMRSRGVEAADGSTRLTSGPPRKRQSKAEQRAELERLMAARPKDRRP
ncbi:hypothetical protein [Mesorhizobium sp. M0496]|uniref:hypothetical protein n=1 Tax=Mesorhizobium sp. M0496 TaxID=2956952 RepID=UPI003334F0D8